MMQAHKTEKLRRGTSDSLMLRQHAGSEECGFQSPNVMYELNISKFL